MNKKIALLAAGIIGSGILGAAPTLAQPTIEFGIGPGGRPEVGVRDPARERYERREYWRQRRDEDRARAYEEGRRDAMRGRRDYGDNCRTVTIREENDFGRTVTRRIRRCD